MIVQNTKYKKGWTKYKSVEEDKQKTQDEGGETQTKSERKTQTWLTDETQVYAGKGQRQEVKYDTQGCNLQNKTGNNKPAIHPFLEITSN